MKKVNIVTGFALLLLLFLSSLVTANDDAARKANDLNNWAIPTGDFFNQRYSRLSQINSSNVSQLKPAWTFSTGVLRGHEGSPLVVDGVMYIHTPFPNNIYAMNLDNGKIIWEYKPIQDPKVIGIMCCDTVNRGLSYAEGKIFLYQADTTLVALDSKNGKLVWKVKNGNPAVAESGTSAPMVFEDKVVVGISGGEYGIQGRITAYDINSGKMVWNGYSQGPDNMTLIQPYKTTHLGKKVGKNSGVTSWKGDQWKTGGGSTWGWYSYDKDTRLMYYGSGNPSTWNPIQRPGDNKWSMTIWARNIDTGKVKWLYQMTPHDEWDYDGVNEMILADITVKGMKRKTLVHFDRNGFGYTLDRITGELLVAEKFDPVVNWATSIDLRTGLPNRVKKYSTEAGGEDTITKDICPAALGSKDQQPAAFSPKTGLFYVPTNHVCMNYEPYEVSYTPGQPFIGANLDMFPPKGEDNLGNFIAWDADKGKIIWSNPERFSVWSGALATAGDVVFYGTLEGYFKAVDAKTGAELYRFKTPSGIIGNVMTYMHNGKQYLAVYSGIGGWAGIGMAAGIDGDGSQGGLGAVGGYKELSKYTKLGGQVTVFSL
ncbi:Methanol dehydrogenase large subunit protein (EC 1.1.2.7) [uncultured Gammaproteobacteria bacterium]|nr:Methanol dehydrogenase large subunit protein (EC 1.1.2.7) [uncultured Gammaproteobacteria bacterium]